MSEYSTLYIGKNEIMSWNSELPPKDDPILSLIFRPSDKKIIKISKKKQEFKSIDTELEGHYICTYFTTVKKVEERLADELLLPETIKQVISNLTSIPYDEVDFSLMDFDSFYETYHPKTDKDMMDEEIEAYEKLQQSYEDYNELLKPIDIGNLGFILFVWKILNKSSPLELVKLDITEIVGIEENPDSFEDINLLSDDFKTPIIIQRKYLDLSFVHFSERKFDLVFIELVISLESAVNKYLTSKRTEFLNGDINLNNMLKDISLISLIKFIYIFIENKPLDEKTWKYIVYTIDRRNNVIHNNMRKFETGQIHFCIESTKKIIEDLDNFIK